MNQPKRLRALLAGGLILLAGVAVTALPELDQAAAAPSRAALQKRAAVQQKVIRTQRATIATLRARNHDQAATIEATWTAIGRDWWEREGTLPQTAADEFAAANAATVAAQTALTGSVTAQIAALPALSLSDVFSALCIRVRTTATGWHCSTYFASGYSSYTFDRY